jgi:hypothetical protein
MLNRAVSSLGDDMAERAPDIRIRIRNLRQEEMSPSSARAKEAFWRPIYQSLGADEDRIDQDGRPREFNPSEMERRFRQALPGALAARLEGFLQDPSRRDASSRAPHIAVVFEVLDLSYGSLDVALAFEPISRVAEAFDKNFDYFRMAFESFVPGAISAAANEAVIPPRRPMNTRDWLVSDISFGPRVEGAFETTPTGPASTSSSWTSADKARWTWIAANTSLLVPTALAAGYLYFAHEDMRDGERERAAATRALQDQQTKLLGVCGTLLGQAVHAPPPAAPQASTKQ